jgi:hypothetical protein
VSGITTPLSICVDVIGPRKGDASLMGISLSGNSISWRGSGDCTNTVYKQIFEKDPIFHKL